MARTIVLGDIHGCYTELLELLDQLGATSDDQLISVGDFLDRGPDSVKVLEYLRGRPNTVALVGNHERKHMRGLYSYSQEITRLQFGEAYADAISWLRSLPYYFETSNAIVVHAALLPGVPLTEQKEEVLCGSVSGEEFLKQSLGGQDWVTAYRGPKPVVFGHRVLDQPLVRDDLVYGLDTGACHGGSLTALVLPERQLCSVRARGNHWASVRNEWQASVVKAKDWERMTWAQIEREQLRWKNHAAQGNSLPEFAQALTQWIHNLDKLVGALEKEMEEFFRAHRGDGDKRRYADQIKHHPLAPLLFQRWHGEVTLSEVRAKFRTPQALGEAAAACGFPCPSIEWTASGGRQLSPNSMAVTGIKEK